MREAVLELGKKRRGAASLNFSEKNFTTSVTLRRDGQIVLVTFRDFLSAGNRLVKDLSDARADNFRNYPQSCIFLQILVFAG